MAALQPPPRFPTATQPMPQQAQPPLGQGQPGAAFSPAQGSSYGAGAGFYPGQAQQRNSQHGLQQ